MLRKSAIVLGAVAASALAAAAQAQSPPPQGATMDCGQPQTRVERMVCTTPELRQLDRDVSRYGMLVSGDSPSAAGQAMWQRQRDAACEMQGGQVDPEGPLYRCLMRVYRTRLVELATSFDRMRGRTGMTGIYRYTGGTGEMRVVEWPDGNATVMIDTMTPPDAPTCSVRIDAPRAAQGLIEGAPARSAACRVQVEADGPGLSVRSSGCAEFCVMNGTFDGTYRR